MPEPISIFDLRRKSKNVALNGGEEAVQVYGLTARQICDHLERYPALASLSIGGTMSPMEAIQGTPGAAAAWISSALGHHSDEKAEAAVMENLTAEDTAYIIQESLGLTFSRGFGPFAARLGALMSLLTVTPGRGQDTRSPMPSPPPPPIPAESSTSEPGTKPLDSLPPSPSSPSDGDSSTSPVISTP